jgi:hypothetical protein
MGMTRNEFLPLCGELLIDPDIALDNDDVRAALQNRDDAAVLRILTEEF